MEYLLPLIQKGIGKMSRLGFDNQPIYCDVAKRCVAMITLKESVKFLTMGALEHEDFTDYQKMKKNRLLREPPPMFHSIRFSRACSFII